jgi:hypothetical protein
MHRTVNVYKLLIIDEIGYLPLEREPANLFSSSSPSAMRKARCGAKPSLSYTRSEARLCGYGCVELFVFTQPLLDVLYCHQVPLSPDM